MAKVIVGLDGVAVHVPRLCVDLTGEWAHVRADALGVAPSDLIRKLTLGIGVRKMAIADAHEDPATMAAMAVKKLVDRLQLDLGELGYLAVGTESSVDQSKSIAAYVLGMLSRHYGLDLSHVGCPQFQFACMGATYALEASSALLRSGDLGTKYAIVVATDRAHYLAGGPAECTQGAGAVAMKLSLDPRLLRLDPRVCARVTLDERDFFRPNGSTTAVVDGQRSIDVYLRCLDGVLAAAIDAAGPAAASVLGADHYLFHTPYPRMAEHAAARLYRRLADLKRGVPPSAWGSEARVERGLDKDTTTNGEFRQWFEARCAQGIEHAGDVGNLYSGALYLSLASLVEALSRNEADAVGKRVILFSYGSGATARLLAGNFAEGFGQVARAVRLEHELEEAASASDRAIGRRRRLTLSEYERLHGEHDHAEANRPQVPASILPANDEFALLRIGNDVTSSASDRGYRYYGFVGPDSHGR